MNQPMVKGALEKYCTECGTVINAKAEICPACGVRQMAAPYGGGVVAPGTLQVAPNGKTKIVAALLAIFLGAFGAHKFYLGQTGRGILYLLFFWTLIPSIISIVEFIVLLTMSDAEFTRKYGFS